jgi:NAD(P)-dependent dehydrogenase (short-subunit alcohol dehydrogenase family)
MTDIEALFPSLKGRTICVTGGASGIGAAIARAFAAQGSRVGILDIDETAGAALMDEIGEGHAFVPCDLRDVAALRSAVAELRDRLGPAGVLVNNAARDDRHDWREVTPDYWDERQAVNLRHMFFAIQAVAPDMIAAGGGSIVNMGSTSWWMAQGNMPGYTSAKAAIHGLTRTMARDLGRHRIRVNCLVPGWIMTERQKTLWVTEEALAAHLDRQCLPDPIQPEEVAPMVLFLASDAARSITAGTFFVDAGCS